jgi:muramidase (phage lysozyme)
MNRKDLQDALKNQNVRAFLHAIRLGEGTSDPDGYRRIVGGDLFDHFNDHPRAMRYIKKYKIWSSAAGAYQIIAKTWDGLVKQYGFPNFSPECQDEAAVALIAEKRALRHVKEGRIETAIQLLGGVWSSLPSSTAGQRTEPMESVLAEYERHGGMLA